jgi:hypothetical protein
MALMESSIYKRCVCGGLIVSMFVGGVALETCEHSANASACPMPPLESIHTHFPEPQHPVMTRPLVLSTATNTGITPPTGQLFVQPQYPDFPNASFVKSSAATPIQS